MPQFRSQLEADYAAHLAALKAAGVVESYLYEPCTWALDHGILKHKCTYTPDFVVRYPDGHIEYHEVKGFMREDAAVKVKLAAAQHPECPFYIVTRPSKKKGWCLKPIPLAWQRKASQKKITELLQTIHANFTAHSVHIITTLRNLF